MANSLSALKVLRVAARVYAAAALVFLAVFVVRFYRNGISANPADWINMSEMVGALFGPPLAFWSIELVLKSIQLQQDQVTRQQDQHEQSLKRENTRLDPVIQRVDVPAVPMWPQGSLGGKTFRLTVMGDATWLNSTIPDGPNPAAITNPDGTVEVILWKKTDSDVSYRGFLLYKRSNGSEGWYRIRVGDNEPENMHGPFFLVAQASGPVHEEDDLHIEVVASTDVV